MKSTLLAIFCMLVVIFISGCTSDPNNPIPSNQNTSTIINTSTNQNTSEIQNTTHMPNTMETKYLVTVEDQDRVCTTDDECTDFDPSCDFCSCGEPINIQHIGKYVQLRREACQGYEGGVCDVVCSPSVNACVNNICTFVNPYS